MQSYQMLFLESAVPSETRLQNRSIFIWQFTHIKNNPKRIPDAFYEDEIQ
ncbi:MAG: hypothetical protein PHI68_00915 [Candidatus Cloacimonetes bacterium]|nr:hypothetical protein [Candidatus Cloacimonadota bacterium]